jgi:hypothetical protein
VQSKTTDVPTVLFESLFYFTELFNMAMVRIVDIMLGQTLSRSVKDSVIFCSVICYELFNFSHE